MSVNEWQNHNHISGSHGTKRARQPAQVRREQAVNGSTVHFKFGKLSGQTPKSLFLCF